MLPWLYSRECALEVQTQCKRLPLLPSTGTVLVCAVAEAWEAKLVSTLATLQLQSRKITVGCCIIML